MGDFLSGIDMHTVMQNFTPIGRVGDGSLIVTHDPYDP